jgi:4-amino-4-deoxy-L-arabinose transferase-like glycosyltransferase
MKHIWNLAGMFAAFLAVRIYFICTFPPFTDESLYIRWGMLMIDKPGFTWASIEHISRQPLAFWLFGFGATIFKNPIIGARLMTLFCNIPTFFFLYSAVKRLQSGNAAFIAIGILTFAPLFILTQTLAIMDGLLFSLATSVLWILYVNSDKYSIIHTAAIAILLACSLWIKTTALFTAILACISVSFILIRNNSGVKNMVIHGILFLVTPVIFLLPLFARSDFQMIFREPQSFLFSVSQISQLPDMWISNSISTLYAFALYLGPFLLLALLFAKPTEKKRMYVFAFVWILLPILSLILVANNFRFRYAALGTICIIPFISIGIQKIKDSKVSAIFWIGVMAYGILFISNPVGIFRLFPEISGERDYAISWPSGYGIPELINWIDSEVKGEEILVAVADSPGNPSDYLLANYYFSPNVQITFVTVNSPAEFRKIEPLTRKIPVYLATRASLITKEIAPYVKEIIRFDKPLHLDAIVFYRISF